MVAPGLVFTFLFLLIAFSVVSAGSGVNSLRALGNTVTLSDVLDEGSAPTEAGNVGSDPTAPDAPAPTPGEEDRGTPPESTEAPPPPPDTPEPTASPIDTPEPTASLIGTSEPTVSVPETPPSSNAPPPETQSPTDSPPETTDSPTVPPPTAIPSPPPTDEAPSTETPTVTTPEPTRPQTVEPTKAPTVPETMAPTVPETKPPTEAPTPQPSVAPTKETAAPTNKLTLPPVTASPSASPSTSETAPTTAPTQLLTSSIKIEDNVSVIISPVSGPMSASNTEHFQSVAREFLSELLKQLEQPIYDVDVVVTGGNIITRRRRLQSDSMQIDMIVSGAFDPVPGLAETAEDYSIGRVSRQFFTVQGNSFVQQLQETDNQEDEAYFQTVSSVESVPVPEDDISPAETPAPPGPAPATENGGGGLAIGGIVAIALVGALVVILGAAFLINNMKRKGPSSSRTNGGSTKKSNTRLFKKANKTKSPSEPSLKKKSTGRQFAPVKSESLISGLPSPEKAVDEPRVSSIGGPPTTIGGPPSQKGSLRRVDSDIISELQWGAESLIGAESNMSYAYSLEDGILVQSPSHDNGSLSSYSVTYENGESPIPAEIPNVSSNPGVDDKNDDDDELDVDKSWSPGSTSIIREITAPPGKLGVILNTSEKGPVVQSVAPGSPLEGMVWPGDVVISIDGIKARKMSAASLMAYMKTNLNKPRKLTMMSDPDA